MRILEMVVEGSAEDPRSRRGAHDEVRGLVRTGDALARWRRETWWCGWGDEVGAVGAVGPARVVDEEGAAFGEGEAVGEPEGQEGGAEGGGGGLEGEG